MLGRGQRVPAVAWAFAFAATALCVGDRLVQGGRGTLSPGGSEIFVAHRITKRRRGGLIAGVPNLVANLPRTLPLGRGRAEKAHCLTVVTGLTGQTCEKF
ncbi:Uncharacterised protein [Mycobacterium tuberculosis]|uniref:Uncharacterized protein n=1 Tax=Mycobacterium tuberculosis TaxID=1773 RepID=A0A655AP92_MYCTX|nr:Uncharacterised protein [Mycobacterium tuberculosis]CFS21634.1 Uncharacterised protein [Mycobacterium tuberculosis]CFS32016.1 Uncharacterised protein [Mycobacterium tuberculosis]CKR65718.1 Uncharacterised protein [Mycobacterium tuberculosis]CKS53352.1 Uncharacterised protein [Mycobacterium tuberculosis]